jgi:hypothetical protein
MSWTRIKVVGGGSGGRVLGRRRKGAAATATFGPSYCGLCCLFMPSASCPLAPFRLVRRCLFVAQNSGDPPLYGYL